MRPIYLDHDASTPIDPAVAAAMRTQLASALGGQSELRLVQPVHDPCRR